MASTNIVNASPVVSEDLKKQREFLEEIKKGDFDFGIVVGKAFVRGMRDLGYKNNGTALNELVDNSIQSEATRVDVIFDFENEKSKKPDRLAIIDNGHGMDPEMIRVAAMWGGTHRENDRTGFGRYGYGLPSASVSIGKKFSIISKVENGDTYSVTIDLDEISEGKYSDNSGRIIVPEPKKIKTPKWVAEYIKNNYEKFENGTIIILDKLDRLDGANTKVIKELLLQNFGSIYRNYLRSFNIFVDSTKVEAIDPLFLTPGFRFFDEDSDKAIQYPELFIDIKDKKEVRGKIKARFSLMPPTFLRIPEHKMQERGTNNNRFKVRKENNGIIILRAGRQIDVVNSKCPWMTFQNNDRYLGIELDFPPLLDEDFSITTSKQQVVLRDRIWDILEEAGVYKAIKKMREDYSDLLKENNKIIQEMEIEKEEKRLSELALEEANKFDTKSKQLSLEQQKEQEKNFNEEVKGRVKKTGKPEEQVKEELLFEINSKPYSILDENLPGAPFFRVEQLGGQKRLYINKDHRFYKDIYMGPNSTPRLRYGLEILLFVIGDCELSADEDRKLFYQTEKQEWSKFLNIALDRLSKWNNDIDAESSKEEKEQSSQLEEERKKSKVA